ncbi:hypothetical protein DL96DRAFT_858941 [Flagelloscypha sp. PMI_526]|nr:hypothetical protein DL96DRAFT_858941 [Flagelloscypha sp. PMI_526]
MIELGDCPTALPPLKILQFHEALPPGSWKTYDHPPSNFLARWSPFINLGTLHRLELAYKGCRLPLFPHDSMLEELLMCDPMPEDINRVTNLPRLLHLRKLVISTYLLVVVSTIALQQLPSRLPGRLPVIFDTALFPMIREYADWFKMAEKIDPRSCGNMELRFDGRFGGDYAFMKSLVIGDGKDLPIWVVTERETVKLRLKDELSFFAEE